MVNLAMELRVNIVVVLHEGRKLVCSIMKGFFILNYDLVPTTVWKSTSLALCIVIINLYYSVPISY